MSEDRIEKRVIRNLWIDTIKERKKSYSGTYPLYLTLSGAEGKDIEQIVEHSIIDLNENGSIPVEYQRTIIAIERSKPAVIRLQEKWPGLKIVEQDFSNIIAGDAIITYPTGDNQHYCCSEIINLDFQDSIKAKFDNDLIRYPIIRWIEKISDIKLEKRPNDPWSLFVTLNADFNEDEILTNIINILNDNASMFDNFRTAINNVLDPDIFNAILSKTLIDNLTIKKKQQLLRIFIPKLLVSILYQKGWMVKTRKNIAYGGTTSPSFMISWMFSCTIDKRSQPNLTYQDGLNSIFENFCTINEFGEISEI